MSAGEWYEVTLRPSTDPAWANLPGDPPDVPSALMRAVVTGESVVILVSSESQGEVDFRFRGDGGHARFDESLFATSSLLTSQSFLAQDGITSMPCALDSAGNLWTAGLGDPGLTSFGDGERAALAAFLA